MTSGGGYLISGEINRNERSARWAVATIEVAGAETSEANLENDTEKKKRARSKDSAKIPKS